MPAAAPDRLSRSPSDKSTSDTSTRQFRILFFAIVALWFAARAAYWNGYYTEDAPGYVTDAIWLARGDYHVRHYVNGLNVGTYFPVALPLWLWGKSEVGLSVWPMACSLLGLLSVSGTAALMLGRGPALLAGFLYATYPGDIFFSTVVMPDAPQAGWLACSIFLIAVAHARRKPGILIAAGVALGMCHLIRANDFVLVPVGLAAVVACSWMWMRERRSTTLRAAALYVAGLASVYAAEGLIYSWAAGDFLHRFHVVSDHYGAGASIARAGLNVDTRTIPFSMFPPVLWWVQGWQPLNHDQAYHALLFCWGLAGLLTGAAVLVTARRVPPAAVAGFALAAVWVGWPPLYHQFGSQSLTAYVPMHRLSRHLVLYGPGAIFAAAAGWSLAAAAVRSSTAAVRGAATAAAAVVLAVHLAFSWQGIETAYGAFHQIKSTYARIRGRLPVEVRTIAADPGDLAFFDFWLNPLDREQVRVVALEGVGSCAELRDGVVLTFSNPGWQGLNAAIIRDTVARLPCLLEPPPDWRLLYDGYAEKVYVIGR